jgi:hypothetical protein
MAYDFAALEPAVIEEIVELRRSTRQVGHVVQVGA